MEIKIENTCVMLREKPYLDKQSLEENIISAASPVLYREKNTGIVSVGIFSPRIITRTSKTRFSEES